MGRIFFLLMKRQFMLQNLPSRIAKCPVLPHCIIESFMGIGFLLTFEKYVTMMSAYVPAMVLDNMSK